MAGVPCDPVYICLLRHQFWIELWLVVHLVPNKFAKGSAWPMAWVFRQCDECCRDVPCHHMVNVQTRGGDVGSFCRKCADAAALTPSRIFAPESEWTGNECVECLKSLPCDHPRELVTEHPNARIQEYLDEGRVIYRDVCQRCKSTRAECDLCVSLYPSCDLVGGRCRRCRKQDPEDSEGSGRSVGTLSLSTTSWFSDGCEDGICYICETDDHHDEQGELILDSRCLACKKTEHPCRTGATCNGWQPRMMFRKGIKRLGPEGRYTTFIYNQMCDDCIAEANTFRKFILCDECHTLRPRIEFTVEMRQVWDVMGSAKDRNHPDVLATRNTRLTCNRCRPEAETIEASYFCHTCKAARPGREFIEEQVASFLLVNQRHLQCIRCYMQDRTDLPEESRYECARCQEEKHIRDFSPADMKAWYYGKRYAAWVCFDCRYPLCVRCEADPETAGKRPFRAVPHNALIEGRYYCPECRYLPCAGCGKAAPCTRYRFKIWLCRECATEGSYTCERCQEAVPVADVCRDSDRSLAHRGKGGTRSIYYCIACSRPRCAACGDAERDPSECKSDRSDVQLSVNGEDVRRTWYCSHPKCQAKKPKPCEKCGIVKDAAEFASKYAGTRNERKSKRCRSCEGKK